MSKSSGVTIFCEVNFIQETSFLVNYVFCICNDINYVIIYTRNLLISSYVSESRQKSE